MTQLPIKGVTSHVDPGLIRTRVSGSTAVREPDVLRYATESALAKMKKASTRKRAFLECRNRVTSSDSRVSSMRFRLACLSGHEVKIDTRLTLQGLDTCLPVGQLGF